jgi:hypothetical protein
MSTISDVIKHDHRELEEFYSNILKATSSDEKIRWQNQFTWELARHSIGEEIVVYPVLEKQVSGGKDLADKDRAEHNKVRSPLFPGGTDRGSGRCSYDTFRLRSFSRSSRIRNPQTPTSTPRSKPCSATCRSISRKRSRTTCPSSSRPSRERTRAVLRPNSSGPRSSSLPEATLQPPTSL